MPAFYFFYEEVKKVQYIIMIAIVLGLAAADFATGIIKAYVNNEIKSSKMRKGGLNKLGEIIVMATACGLEIGIKLLGNYYNSENFAAITGKITAIAVFIYIVLMELVSILENYAAINTEAAWAAKIIKKLKNVNNEED